MSKNWADSKQSVNSVKPQVGNTEPRHRSMREGVETGHGSTLIECSKCHTPKPEKDFYKKDRKTGRRDTTCKACRIVLSRQRTLGVTEEDYWRMYHEQSGKCGICRRRLYSKRYKSFCVDHDHATGEIRGLLCHNCNRAIGMLRDCPTTLRRAVEWVEGTVRSSEQSETNGEAVPRNR